MMTITHEINVHVMNRRRMDELKEPMCPVPNARLLSPSENNADVELGPYPYA